MRSAIALLIVALNAAALLTVTAAEQKENNSERIHFLVVSDDNAVRLVPTDAASKLEEGQSRLSCRSLRIERQDDQAVIVFVDAQLESDDTLTTAKEMSLGSGSPMIRCKQGRLQFKTEEAERRFRKHVNRVINPTEEGMKASEIEHRERWNRQVKERDAISP